MASIIRRALVTGATSGIGRAIAEGLAARGVAVLVTGRDVPRGLEVVQGIRAERGRAEFVAADMASPASIASLAVEAQRVLGGIDILVNNAGIYSFGPTSEVDEVAFDKMYAVNVRAPLLLTAQLAPSMMERRWGRIVNVTTMVAYVGMAGAALYGSSKAALQLLTQAWAAEFGPTGVTANTIAPGPVRTPGTLSMGDALERIAGTIPAGRVGTPQEIAAAAVFLASEAAGYVNGAVLAVDGGRVAV